MKLLDNVTELNEIRWVKQGKCFKDNRTSKKGK